MSDVIDEYLSNITKFVSERGFNEVYDKFPEFPRAVSDRKNDVLSRMNKVILSIKKQNEDAEIAIENEWFVEYKSLMNCDVELVKIVDEHSALELMKRRSDQEAMDYIFDNYGSKKQKELKMSQKRRESLAISYFFPSMNLEQKAEVIEILLIWEIKGYEYLYMQLEQNARAAVVEQSNDFLLKVKNNITYPAKGIFKDQQNKIIEYIQEELNKRKKFARF